MERVNYWRALSERLDEGEDGKRGTRTDNPAWRRDEAEKVVIVWGGRELSQESYLAVPTFIRRGVRLVV